MSWGWGLSCNWVEIGGEMLTVHDQKAAYMWFGGFFETCTFNSSGIHDNAVPKKDETMANDIKFFLLI